MRNNITFTFLAGLYFAILQFCYFFMLEAFLSSRAISFFISLFFWLIGFLIGLNQKPSLRFSNVLALSLLTYYIAFFSNSIFPYHKGMLLLTGAMITFSGIAPGYFFIEAQKRFLHIKSLFLHENNGFLLGVVISLFAAIFCGKWLLYLGPGLTIIPVFILIKYPSPKFKKITNSCFPLFTMGLHLGILQIAVYFMMQCFVTATFLAYFGILAAWMGGVIISMKYKIPKGISQSSILSLASYYLLFFIVTQFQPTPLFYPLILVLLFILAFPAGAFFRKYAKTTASDTLFFHENNGFILGYILSLVAFLKWGVNFLYFGPLLSLFCCLLPQKKKSLISYLLLCGLCIFCLITNNIAGFWILLLILIWGAFTMITPTKPANTIKTTALNTIHKTILFISGINLILLQYFLTREFSSILSANELTILMVASAYLIGFSVGYGLCKFLSLKFLRITAIGLFFLHLFIFLSIKFFAGYCIAAGYNYGVLFLLLAITAFLTSTFYSLFLPKCINQAGSQSLVSYYTWDLLGALLGGVLMFGVITHFPLLLWPLYFSLLAILIIILLYKSPWLYTFIPIAILAIGFIIIHQGNITRLATEDYYQTRGYNNPKLLFAGNSFYHSIEVLESYQDPQQNIPKKRTAFINGIRYFSYQFDKTGTFSNETSLSEFTYFLAKLPAKYLYQKLGRKIRILILGAGSMYSLARVENYASKTTLVEIDPLVVNSSKEYWKDINQWDKVKNYEIIIDDAKHYLRTTDEKFDLIIMDISAPYYLGTLLLHNKSFFKLAKEHLKPQGIFAESTQSRPQPSRPHSTAMKILKGIVDVFPDYRVIDCRKKPRGRRGFVYATKEFPFKTKELVAIMKQDNTYTGTATYSPGSPHFNFKKTTAYSLTNMESLLAKNTSRLKRRLNISNKKKLQSQKTNSELIKYTKSIYKKTLLWAFLCLTLGLSLSFVIKRK